MNDRPPTALTHVTDTIFFFHATADNLAFVRRGNVFSAASTLFPETYRDENKPHKRNHPKSTVLFKFFALPYFAGKKAMFNLNENNRIVMSQHPSDMRIGVNGMCGQVRKVGLDPSNGDVYIFVGRSRQLMKILHWERGGYVMYYKRLEQGRFHPRIFLREGIGFRTMRWDELVLLMEGISPKVARRKRFPNPNGKLELNRKK